MTHILFITSISAFAYLCLSVGVCRGIPVSLSYTYYELGGKGWLFQAVMSVVAITLLPVWISVSSEPLRFLVFLSCASLLFVAAAPSFRLEPEGKVHYISAAVCCICSTLWQILEGVWDVTLYFAASALVFCLHDTVKWCWWVECAVIGSLLANLWRIV